MIVTTVILYKRGLNSTHIYLLLSKCKKSLLKSSVKEKLGDYFKEIQKNYSRKKGSNSFHYTRIISIKIL